MSNSSPSPWGLDSKHGVQTQSNDALSMSHSILESLRQRRGAETAAWLNTLVDVNQLTANPGAGSTKTVEQEHEHQLVQWVDKLFDQFDLYSTRFNQTAQGTDLVVTSTRPNVQNPELFPPTESNGLPEKVYEGHLVTRFWAMLLRGNVGAISVYIIPAEILLGFSLHRIDESIYKPLMVINSCWKNDRLSWDIGGTCIVIEQVPMLAKELFGDLVRVASGQMTEEELFVHSTGEHLAIGNKVPCADPPVPQAEPVDQFIPQASIPSPMPQIASQDFMPPPNTSLSKIAPLTGISIRSTSQSRLPAQAPPQVSAQSTPNTSISLTAPRIGSTMLSAIEADMNQLIQLGKTALTSEDTEAFHKLKSLTERMESLKQTLTTALTEIASLSNQENQK